VQNLVKEIASAGDMEFEVTEKLEGSSMTCYLIDGVFGVCSRNLDLKETADNTFWQVARELDIEAKMRDTGPDAQFAIQGELIGPGIQGNIYKLSKPEFHVFDVYNIQAGDYLKPDFRRALIQRMGLTHVPVLNEGTALPGGVDILLEFAEGKSRLNPAQEREGIVFKQVDGGMTFKAISNKYLLGEK
jgi:RNA ligase (TIGR02306 family)